MQTAPHITAAFAALALCATTALAGDVPGSSPTLPRPSRPEHSTAVVSLSAPQAGETPGPGLPVTLALVQTPAPAQVEFSGVHYRPRSGGRHARQPESAGVSQLHVGWFDPDGSQDARFDIGIRGGPMLDEHLQLGLGVDWIHESENVSSVTTSTIGPGGVPIQVQQNIERSSVNMFPIMGFVQISAPDDMLVVPYFGAGAGYQVLALSGDDFTTGRSYEATFGGWGWQLWGGLGLPLGGRSRLTGELFVNGAELGRDVIDYVSGTEVHETVNGDGMGLRFGMAWGF